MTDAEADFDLLVLRKMVLAALDAISEMPPDSPTRRSGVAALEAFLRRVTRVASESRQAAAEGALMLERIVADHRK
jgi:hypothetical protein